MDYFYKHQTFAEVVLHLRNRNLSSFIKHIFLSISKMNKSLMVLELQKAE